MGAVAVPGLPPEVAAQKAAIVAARIVRMRRVRTQVAADPSALVTVRANLRAAAIALRTFNRVRKGREVPDA